MQVFILNALVLVLLATWTDRLGAIASSSTGNTAAVAANANANTDANTDANPSSSTAEESCDNPTKTTPNLTNSAFVFVKPHANTPQTRSMVKSKIQSAGISILSEGDIDGQTIDDKRLIDRHYYAIASKATILSAKDMPVPSEKFKQWSGESWSDVLRDDRACNALEACQRFKCTAAQLNDAWQSVPDGDMIKLGGGFYCAKLSMSNSDDSSNGADSTTLYVFNAFFMNMRARFIGSENSIHYYEVSWDPSVLKWSDFRHNILGPTDPAEAPDDSIRRTILNEYKSLGLTDKPNKGDNGVHASASPFEGLVEKTNWLGRELTVDAFGKALIDAGVPVSLLEAWSVDPQIIIGENGETGSIFDSLEDLDSSDCLEKMIKLTKLQK